MEKVAQHEVSFRDFRTDSPLSRPSQFTTSATHQPAEDLDWSNKGSKARSAMLTRKTYVLEAKMLKDRHLYGLAYLFLVCTASARCLLFLLILILVEKARLRDSAGGRRCAKDQRQQDSKRSHGPEAGA